MPKTQPGNIRITFPSNHTEPENHTNMKETDDQDFVVEKAVTDRKQIFLQGGYPYRRPLGEAEYNKTMTELQIELVKAQA
ncbi:hypothetical protein BH23CHL5_BH23CHL5_17130 [soil metagenome]